MKDIFWAVLVVIVLSTAGGSATDLNSSATPYSEDEIASIINQNAPSKLACFPICPGEMGKRGSLSKANEIVSRSLEEQMQNEQSPRRLSQLHPKFRRWLENGPLSSQGSHQKQQLGAEYAWKRAGRTSFERLTSSKRADENHFPHANLI